MKKEVAPKVIIKSFSSDKLPQECSKCGASGSPFAILHYVAETRADYFFSGAKETYITEEHLIALCGKCRYPIYRTCHSHDSENGTIEREIII